MKKVYLIFIVGAITIFLTGITLAQEKAKSTTKQTTISKKVAEVVVDTFETSNLWQGKPMEWKEGAVEETSDDSLKLSLNTDAKFAKSGKKSLKIEYIPSVVSKNKFARLNRNCEKQMGENNAISFWVYIASAIPSADGNAIATIDLFDNETWKKCSSSEIPLNFKGWKKISLSKKDFSNTDNWNKINIIQLSIIGKVTLYIDDISFTKM